MWKRTAKSSCTAMPVPFVSAKERKKGRQKEHTGREAESN